jgi:hypothetical protein
MTWLLDCFFDRYQWYRRLCGGRWELWWVDAPVCSDIWHRVTDFTYATGKRPSVLCRGTPIEEDWTR